MTIDPAAGPMIQANSDSTGYHNVVGTAIDGQGNSIVAWTDYFAGGNNTLFAQSYQRNGTPIGSQFQVNQAGTNAAAAAVAMNAGGTAIFVWSVASGVYSQRFNNSTGVAIDSAPVLLFSMRHKCVQSLGRDCHEWRLRGQLLHLFGQHLYGQCTGLQLEQRAPVG